MDQSMDQSTCPWIGNLNGCRCRAVGRHVYAVGRHVHGCIDRSTCLWTYPWTCLWHLTYTHYIYIIHYSISHYTKKKEENLVLGVAHQGGGWGWWLEKKKWSSGPTDSKKVVKDLCDVSGSWVMGKNNFWVRNGLGENFLGDFGKNI